MTESYPLRWPDGWPRKRTAHLGASRFTVSPDTAYRSLNQELNMLGAKGVVVSSNLPISKRYNTPLLSEDGPNMDNGVAVYFMLNGRQMVMAQDIYNRTWANMRSLALAVAAMRALERHGGGTMMQRAFDGFAQLPPPGGHSEYQKKPWREILEMTGQAWEVLPKDAQLMLAEGRFKKMAREKHPDNGGNAQLMAELNIAIDDARQELQ